MGKTGPRPQTLTKSLSTECWMDRICALAESLLFDDNRTGDDDRSRDSTGQSQGLLRVHKYKGVGSFLSSHSSGRYKMISKVSEMFPHWLLAKSHLQLCGCWPRPNPSLGEVGICKEIGHNARAAYQREAKTKAVFWGFDSTSWRPH